MKLSRSSFHRRVAGLQIDRDVTGYKERLIGGQFQRSGFAESVGCLFTRGHVTLQELPWIQAAEG